MDWEKHFAQTNFHPYQRHYALAMRVLAVATTRVEGTWCAYCDAVPGNHHDYEMSEVLDHGDKLGEEVARVLFPEMEGVPYAG